MVSITAGYVRVGSQVPVHGGCQLRPELGVKRTFLAKCLKLKAKRTCPAHGWNGEN
jgi:hypothetical protein